MLHVPIDKIIPLTTARDTLSKIIADVESGTPLYVLTKNGKPSVAVMSIDYLHKQVGTVEIAQPQRPQPQPEPIQPETQAATPTPQPSPDPQTAANQTPPSPPTPTSPPVSDFWGHAAAASEPTTLTSPPATPPVTPTASTQTPQPSPPAAAGSGTPAANDPGDMMID